MSDHHVHGMSPVGYEWEPTQIGSFPPDLRCIRCDTPVLLEEVPEHDAYHARRDAARRTV